MKILKKTLQILILSFFLQNISNASVPYFIDFKFILNESQAGKKAQKFLKEKLEKGIKNIQTEEKKILDQEKQLINQKKVISPEEYKNKVKELRKKVSSLQKKKKFTFRVCI